MIHRFFKNDEFMSKYVDIGVIWVICSSTDRIMAMHA